MINAPSEWDPDLEVGNPLIDDQHRALFDMIVTLDRQMNQEEFGEATLSALQGMKNYAAKHFAYEESLMEKAAWPSLNAHRAMHAEFMHQTGMFGGEALADSEWTSLDMLRFLLKWLVTHIRVEDRIFFDWSRDN